MRAGAVRIALTLVIFSGDRLPEGELFSFNAGCAATAFPAEQTRPARAAPCENCLRKFRRSMFEVRLFNSYSLFKRNHWHIPGIFGRGTRLESQVLLSKAFIFQIAACGYAGLSTTIEVVHYKNYENDVTRLGGQVHQILFFAEVHSRSIAIVRYVSLGSERPRCSCVGVSTKARRGRRQGQSES